MALAAHELANTGTEPTRRHSVVAPGWGQEPTRPGPPPAPRASLRRTGSAPERCARATGRSGAAAVRRRRVGALALMALLAGAVLAVSDGRPAVVDDARPVESSRVLIVGPGETLWEVAGPHAPEGVQRHFWVRRVARANGLDPRAVRPGTAVRLPGRGS